jgi:hypothetical protein
MLPWSIFTIYPAQSTIARDDMAPPWQTSRTRSLTKSQARSLLSMARLNSAKSR